MLIEAAASCYQIMQCSYDIMKRKCAAECSSNPQPEEEACSYLTIISAKLQDFAVSYHCAASEPPSLQAPATRERTRST